MEYLNFEPAGPYGFASNSPSAQLNLWRSVLRRRTSPNGVFGVKSFPNQLEALNRQNPALVSDLFNRLLGRANPRIVYLARRDRVAHAVSYARASLSGIWRKEQEGPDPRVAYSEQAVRVAEQGIEALGAAWETMFRDLRIEPLRLWHEDVVARPEQAAARTAEYLGVTLSASAAIQVPAIEEQDRLDSKQWISRYSGGARTS